MFSLPNIATRTDLQGCTDGAQCLFTQCVQLNSWAPGVVIQDSKTDHVLPLFLSIYTAVDCHRTQAPAHCLPAQNRCSPRTYLNEKITDNLQRI